MPLPRETTEQAVIDRCRAELASMGVATDKLSDEEVEDVLRKLMDSMGDQGRALGAALNDEGRRSLLGE
jgi:hypothetical protein